MASPSPSDYLTLSRRLVLSQPARFVQSAQRIQNARPLSIATIRYAQSQAAAKPNHSSHDQGHATNKKSNLDVQAEQAKKGQSAQADKDGDAATSQSDKFGGKQKAKEEHPEAPDTIGMQDHRGHSG